MRWRIRSAIVRLTAAIIVALHCGLLWQRVEDLSILRPDVLARWCGAAIVAAAAFILLRRRVSWRTWLVFWLAVFLLHAAPLQDGRSAAPIEAVFAVASLMLLAAGAVAVDAGRSERYAESQMAAPPAVSLAASLSTRAPPLR